MIFSLFIEEYARLTGEFPIFSFDHMNLNAGAYFGTGYWDAAEEETGPKIKLDERDLQDFGSPQLDLNFGTFYPRLSRLEIDPYHNLKASFDVEPVRTPYEPYASMRVNTVALSSGSALQVGHSYQSPTPDDKYLSMASLKYFNSKKVSVNGESSSNQYQYIVPNARVALELRNLMGIGGTAAGFIQVLSASVDEHLEGRHLYSMPEQREDMAGLQEDCIDLLSVYPQELDGHTAGFEMQVDTVAIERKGRFADKDEFVQLECDSDNEDDILSGGPQGWD